MLSSEVIVQRSMLWLSLVLSGFFGMACSCQGCFWSNYAAVVYAEDGETVIAEGRGQSEEAALQSACSTHCAAQVGPEACHQRCVAGEGVTVEVRWDGGASLWGLVSDILSVLLRRSCQG